MKEFYVERVQQLPAHTLVSGRVYQGSIAVGDTLNTAFRPLYEGSGENLRRVGRRDERAVSLHVEGVEAYRRAIESIDEGMTGMLRLSGPEKEILQPGDIITAE